MDSSRFSEASLDNLTSGTKNFPSMDANWMKDDLLNKKLAYLYEKLKARNFFEPVNLKTKDAYPTLKKLFSSNTKISIVFFKIINVIDLTMLHLKNDVLLSTNVFENALITCKSVYAFNPLFLYSTPSYTWKTGLNKYSSRYRLYT